LPGCGDPKKWDCGQCIMWKLQKNRNCGGRFPEGNIGQNGFELSDFKIYECPKTYIKKSVVELLEMIRSAKQFGIKLLSDKPEEIQNYSIEILKTIELEMERVRQAIQARPAPMGEASNGII
jgi:hypothetical protein